MTHDAPTRQLPVSQVHPPHPRTDRQASLIELADGLAEIAAGYADAHDRAGSFPHETFAELHKGGYLSLTVPEEFGGGGAAAVDVMLAQEHLARGSGSVALGTTMHLGIMGGLASSRHWPPALLERVFADVVERGALINSAASEPDLGSPSRGGMFHTTATRDGSGWRINGRKTWTTMSPGLMYAIVLLTVEEHGDTARGQFLVPMDTEGVIREENWDNLSMRSSGSNDVVFDNVLVADEYRLPQPTGLPGMQGSDWSLLGSAVYLGIAQAARDFAVEFAKHRVPSGLGTPIAELQTVQHRIAQIDILLAQARSLLYLTAETWADQPDQRESLAWRMAAAKYTVTNNAIAVTDQALRVVGSVGLQRSLPLERYFRDVRAGLGNPPMDDVALTMIGKTALDLG
ncbi:MAG: acyl-CoA/acyl-ACP dehydrogenase [Chloroflexia bacterium]|nr:acyl-CoA/acyl-ACP dehydrogenase [Chloroflexia bacterium]